MHVLDRSLHVLSLGDELMTEGATGPNQPREARQIRALLSYGHARASGALFFSASVTVEWKDAVRKIEVLSWKQGLAQAYTPSVLPPRPCFF
jgi:hypothetical protein